MLINFWAGAIPFDDVILHIVTLPPLFTKSTLKWQEKCTTFGQIELPIICSITIPKYIPIYGWI
jgi:hypothetical protein